MQKVSITFFPTDNNAMGGVSLHIEVGGISGVDVQWVRDLADAITPVIPVEALGWTAPAEVSGITIHPDPYDVQPNP